MSILDPLNPHTSNVATLRKFRELLVEYIEVRQLQHSNYLPPEQQQLVQKLPEIRRKINEGLSVAKALVRQSGAPTSIHYSPPPAVGGLAGEMDIFNNIFNNQIYGVSFPGQVKESVDRAIGVREHWRKIFWKYWFNPFNWIKELIRIPFHIIRFAGFNGKKSEESVVGKIYKLVAGFLVLAAALVTVLTFFNIKSADLFSLIKTKAITELDEGKSK